MKLFNLVGVFNLRTIKSEGNLKECWIEAEGNKYYVPSFECHKFIVGQKVNFCSFVADHPESADLCVSAYGHAPYEASNIISYGIGDSAGLNENEVSFTEANGTNHLVVLK